MKILKATILILIASVLIIEPAFAKLPSDDIIDHFDQQHIYYYNPNGSDDLCGSSATMLAGNNAEEKIWNYFIQQGFSDMQVAGILGNTKQESDNTVTLSKNGNFYGLFQYHTGYNQALLDKITAAGLGDYLTSKWWSAEDAQKVPAADFDKLLKIELDYAMDGYGADWIPEVKKQSSVEAAAEAFLTMFERAVGGDSPILYHEPFKGLYYQDTDKRRNYALEYYKRYSGKGTSASTNLNATENGANLTIFGDSITVTANDTLLKKFPLLTQNDIHAMNGRKWGEAVDVVKNTTNIKDTVIFALGTNNISEADTLKAADIDSAIQAIGANKNIIFVTNWIMNNEYDSNNALLADYAKLNSNITLADWKNVVKPQPNLLYDGIHPTAEGSEKFADLLYETVNSNATIDGCSVSGEFASVVKAYAWPEYKGPTTNRMPAYAEAVSRSISEGRYVGGSIDGVPGIDCGGFVTILTQNSGLEPNYNDRKGNTTTQEEWVKDHHWLLLNGSPNQQIDTSILQPGDIAFSLGHTFIYVGDIPGFGSKIASAAYSFSRPRAPMAGREDLVYGKGVIVRWYRNPKYSARNNLNYANNLQNTVWSN